MSGVEAFEREYRGAGRPRDALWWAEHPGTVAPSGRMDPMVEVRALREALYRPGATAADRVAFDRAEHAFRAEQAEVARALTRARGERQAPSPSAREARPASEAPGGGPARRRRGPWLILLPVALLLAVGAAHVLGVTATAPSNRHAAPQTPSIPTPVPSLVATSVAPVALSVAQERVADRLIAEAFSKRAPSAGDFDAIETGQSAWARAKGCEYTGGLARISASGAPMTTDVQLIAGHGGSTQFRVVIILKKSDVVAETIWARPHSDGGRAPVGNAILKAQNSTPSPLVVGVTFSTDRPADIQRLYVATGSGTPFRAEIEACQGSS